jgi:hypothetical protein
LEPETPEVVRLQLAPLELSIPGLARFELERFEPVTTVRVTSAPTWAPTA